MSYLIRYFAVLVVLVSCFSITACGQKTDQVEEEELNTSSSSGGAASGSVSNVGFPAGGGETGTSATGDDGGASADNSIDDTGESTPTEDEAEKATAIVDISPASINVAEGTTFALNVVANFSAASEGGGVSLRYDPAVLEVLAVNVNRSAWNFVANDGEINNVDGSVSNILFSSYQGVSGGAAIAVIEFKSVGKGSSNLTIEQSPMNPFASNGKEMNVSFRNAQVVVN